VIPGIPGANFSAVTKNKTTTALQLSATTILVGTLLIGCASAPKSDPPAAQSEAQAQIERRLQETSTAAEQKDFPRLDRYHLYGPMFTKYSAASADRQDTAAARAGEHDGLAAIQSLSMRADNLKIDVFGQVGIATFTLAYRFVAGGEILERQEQSTLVFVNDHGQWKIAHEHFSPLPPRP
jgi:ketosteroid isomerase-like protein